MPVLETILLGKYYPSAQGRLQALQGISLRLEAGETLVVVGPQGAGKTTLLNLLAGLDRPTRGTLHLDGLGLNEVPRWRLSQVRAEKVGFVTPRPHLLPERTVLENVAWPLGYLPRERRRAGSRRAQQLLARAGLEGRAAARPEALSPAEQQRAAIARALVNRPAILLADEPAKALDPAAGREIVALLREMAREEGTALVLATEDESLATEADQVLRLPEEGLAAQAAPGAVPGGPALSSGEVLADTYAAELQPLTRPLAPLIRFFLRPALYTMAVAVLITYLCFFGLELAARERAAVSASQIVVSPGSSLGARVWRTAGDSLSQTVQYLGRAVRGDLGSIRQYGYYYWADQRQRLVRDIVVEDTKRSLPLLGSALALAGLIGVPLGMGTALARRSRLSVGFIALAVAGISVPSFFLAFLLQFGEIAFYRRTGIQLVPLGGYGLGRHLILPALVLAARPIAQVARVSFVALAEVLDADYIRTARAKGLGPLAVLAGHALRNASVPILTALGTSLRFALSSLPVVETIFSWPGMGQRLLQAMNAHQLELAASLTLTLGLFFTVVNVGLENLNRLVDPRLDGDRTRLGPQRSWTDPLQRAWQGVLDLPLWARSAWARVVSRLSRGVEAARPGRAREALQLAGAAGRRPQANRDGQREAQERARDAAIRRERRRAWARHTIGSVPFTLGALILVALAVVCAFGPQLAPHDPFTVVPSRIVNGQMVTPPFPPSPEFPLGSDPQGRDILSLLLVGARRTLSIALFAVLARILLGAILGCLAGWFAGSFLDRALMAAIEVLAAFPALLLAMVVIFALGIKQGMWVFVAGLCAVGWGEAAQFVRGQVMTIREKDYIEGALAVGLGDMQILLRQALPNLFPSLIVLAFLEMGGVMMLLGELGFIGLFIGGGARTTNEMDQIITYFDVPEWGVMLSHTWRSFRTYPWATLYPALAFTLAIIGFNFFGEGLRRLTERLTVNLNRVFNRYTLGAAAAIAALAILASEGAGPWGRYKGMADGFDAERALAHVRVLAGPEMEGRRSGTPGADRAADYIAGQFRALALQPAGELQGVEYTYFQTVAEDYRDLVEPARLALQTWEGEALEPLSYGQDFIEYVGGGLQAGTVQAEVVFAAAGPWGYSYYVGEGAWTQQLAGRIVLTEQISTDIARTAVAGVLLIRPGEWLAGQRHLQGQQPGTVQHKGVPYLFVSEEVADRILALRGYSLEDLRERQRGLEVNEGFALETGVVADVRVSIQERQGVPTRHVLAMYPGTDAELDAEAIFVVAHYDGLGRWPDGAFYPGANDNASGVGVMLEAARVLQESDFQPKRTIFFLGWGTAERQQELDLRAMLAARLGFLEAYRITAVIEVRGVGAGTGSQLIMDESSSGRLTDVVREAARRQKVSISTHGQTVHASPMYPSHGRTFVPLPGRKRLPYVALSWDGSNATEHLTSDTVETIDPKKLEQTGRTLALALMQLAGQARY